jgi:malonate transporter and related proteins
VSIVLRILTETLIPVFFVLGLGFYAGIRGRVDNRNTASINVLLMHFALPCSLFLGIARTSTALLRSQAPLLAILAIAMALTYAVQFGLNRRIFRTTIEEAAVGSLTVSFGNNVAVGLPLLVAVYGPPGLTAVAVGIVIGAVLLSPVTLVLLECHDRERAASPLGQRVISACLQTLKRPVILAPFGGLLWLLAGIKVPVALGNSLDLIGKGTVGVALFLTGLLLSAQPFRFSANVFAGILVKNLVQPVLVVALILLFRVHGDLGREALLVAALPTGFFGTVFGARYGITSIEVNSTLVSSTIISIVTIPAAYLLSSYLP